MGITSGTETPYPSCVVRVAQTLVLYVVFCGSLLAFLFFFFLPLMDKLTYKVISTSVGEN